MAISWQADYETGLGDIDSDHKKLVDLLNQVERSVEQAQEADQIDLAIGNLIAGVAQHFEREESLMKACAYPQLASHAGLHAEFSSKLGKLNAASFLGAGRIDARDLLDLLADWLIVHIQKADQDYVPWAQGKLPA
jgi:hemerythrin